MNTPNRDDPSDPVNWKVTSPADQATQACQHWPTLRLGDVMKSFIRNRWLIFAAGALVGTFIIPHNGFELTMDEMILQWLAEQIIHVLKLLVGAGIMISLLFIFLAVPYAILRWIYFKMYPQFKTPKVNLERMKREPRL
jgi:hypothetical protein